jgi:hypothetical protein
MADAIEDPRYHLFVQVVMEYVQSVTHRSTVYVSWLCRLNLNFLTYIHSVFLVAMLYFDSMDPQCMIGGHDPSL